MTKDFSSSAMAAPAALADLAAAFSSSARSDASPAARALASAVCTAKVPLRSEMDLQR